MRLKDYLSHYQVLERDNVSPDNTSAYLGGFYKGNLEYIESRLSLCCPHVCSGCGDPLSCGQTPTRCDELMTALLAMSYVHGKEFMVKEQSMIYSHDTGENRPLIEICDECDSDPNRCGCNPIDCEEAEREIQLEKQFEATRQDWD